MVNKNTQIRNKMIKQYPKTDREKLAGLERHIHEKHPIYLVAMEPYLIFTKGEDKFIKLSSELNEWTVQHRHVHHCDLFLIHSTNSRQLVIELDGSIHDIKTEKTDKRNARYELNNIPYIVINESELKEKLGVPKSRPLTQDQINEEFDEKFQLLKHI